MTVPTTAHVSQWEAKSVALYQLRSTQILQQKCKEIDDLLEYALERIPAETRRMKLSQLREQADFPYKATKRSRIEMEQEKQPPYSNSALINKVKNQLSTQSQNIILPSTDEYEKLPPGKREHIIDILNSIINVYKAS